jgi:Family of unknown function (DUF5372)
VHPFHPRLGEQFLILKCRRIGSVLMLSLRDESGRPLFTPLEWTDRAPPYPHQSLTTPPPMLEVGRLLELVGLVQSIQRKKEERKGALT